MDNLRSFFKGINSFNGLKQVRRRGGGGKEEEGEKKEVIMFFIVLMQILELKG